jgi:Domain of unknown function DUF29
MTDFFTSNIMNSSERQTVLLRQKAAVARVNSRVDWKHPTEEIESMERNKIDPVESELRQAFMQDLKGLPHGFRARARRENDPSMHQEIDRTAIRADALDGQPLPHTCSVRAEEISRGV